MTSLGYEVGDKVTTTKQGVDPSGGVCEFLGVAYEDDCHYYRREVDGLIIHTYYPAYFSKYVPKPVVGEVWRASNSNGILRTVLCVTADYVIYSATHAGSKSEPYLHVKPFADFMQWGVRVE